MATIRSLKLVLISVLLPFLAVAQVADQIPFQKADATGKLKGKYLPDNSADFIAEVMVNAGADTLQAALDKKVDNTDLATTLVPGIVELATVAEANAGTDTTRAVTSDGLPMRLVGTAWIGALMTGNARGDQSLDIQNARTGVTEVASGDFSSAYGLWNTASGLTSIAHGASNTASGDNSTAVGNTNTASGSGSVSVGSNNVASGSGSVAIGTTASASGISSFSFGRRAKTTVDNSVELGWWVAGTTRSSAVRMQDTGQVSMTIQDQAAAYTDGGATAGSEANGTVGRGMFSFRRDGLNLYIDLNVAGAITTLPMTGFLPLSGGSMTGNIAFTDAGEGVSFNGGGSVTGTSGAIAVTASGANQDVVLTPSGNGEIRLASTNNGASATKATGSVEATLGVVNAPAGLRFRGTQGTGVFGSDGYISSFGGTGLINVNPGFRVNDGAGFGVGNVIMNVIAGSVSFMGTLGGANTWWAVNNGFISEGATADGFEGTFTFPNWTADQTIAFMNDSGTVVLGPGTTTDNTIPRFDGTGGKLQTSGVTIDDADAITASNLSGTNTGDPPMTTISARGTGTAYTLTTTPDSAMDFGTTDPSITINAVGTWMLYASATLNYVGATYAGSETITFQLRRTNNTPANITNTIVTLPTQIITTLTVPGESNMIPIGVYTTANTDDILTITGSVTALPSVGSVEISDATITAVRIK